MGPTLRTLLCCLGLLFAAPAFANSIEDGLCHAPPQPVERMERSEKLCRAFIRALGKLPGETMKEVEAMLSPESLALMGTMTAAWVGTQGVPVVGQAVDAALLVVGVAMAAAQTAAVKDAVWNYVNLAINTKDEEGLDKAAAHLARAVAVVGVSVVTFILTKKVSGKLGKPQGPPEPPPSPLLEPVPVAAGVPVSSPARVKPGVVPGTGVAPALASSGGRSKGGPTPVASVRPKKVDLQAFKAWLAKADRRPASTRSDAFEYQRKHAGPEEIQVSGDGQQVWADGARVDSAKLVETKHMGSPESSPFIPGSKCSDYVRSMVHEQLVDEFSRYAAVINDPQTPAVALEVVVNDSRAVPFFEAFLRQFEIPGEVVVRP